MTFKESDLEDDMVYILRPDQEGLTVSTAEHATAPNPTPVSGVTIPNDPRAATTTLVGHFGEAIEVWYTRTGEAAIKMWPELS